jgi:hypothetical protein
LHLFVGELVGKFVDILRVDAMVGSMGLGIERLGVLVLLIGIGRCL